MLHQPRPPHLHEVQVEREDREGRERVADQEPVVGAGVGQLHEDEVVESGGGGGVRGHLRGGQGIAVDELGFGWVLGGFGEEAAKLVGVSAGKFYSEEKFC